MRVLSRGRRWEGPEGVRFAVGGLVREAASEQRPGDRGVVGGGGKLRGCWGRGEDTDTGSDLEGH